MEPALLVLLQEDRSETRGRRILEKTADQLGFEFRTYPIDGLKIPDPLWSKRLCVFFLEARPKQARDWILMLGRMDPSSQIVLLVHSGDVREVRQKVAYTGVPSARWLAINPSLPLFEQHVLSWVQTTKQRRSFRSTLDRVQLRVNKAPGLASGEVRKLLVAQQHFENILRNAHEAIISTDPAGRIMFYNRAAARLFQVDEKEVLNAPLYTLAPGEWREHFKALQQNGGDLPGQRELSLARKDGEPLTILVKYDAIHQEPGSPTIGLTVLASDITQAKRQEQELRTHQKRLEEALNRAKAANQAKDRFLAALSHELRTPLMPISMTVSTLLKQKRLPTRFRKPLELINRNLNLEVKLIDDLLDLSRTMKEKAEPKRFVAFDLLKTFRKAWQVCASDFGAKRQKVVLDAQASKLTVEGDPDRLQQVFWNLLKNASKFSPEGAQISVSFANRGDDLFVRIRDPGIGIKRELLPKIFNFYEQGQSKEGLGLGLWISKTIIEAHRGKLSASSKGQGCGSTFTVQLPLASTK